MSDEPPLVIISGIHHVVSGRPPFLPPRRRDVNAAEVGALRDRIIAALSTEPGTRIEIAEWVGFDARDLAHTTIVLVIEPTRYVSLSIGKEVSKVAKRDIHAGMVGARWRASF
jgi:hypothetical protein